MSRRLLYSMLSATALFTAASPLAAEPAGLDAAFGNTIVSTYPDGRVGKLWLHKDGGYTAEGRRHDRSSGKWTQKDNNLCLKQRKPMSVPFHFCTPMIQGGVGSTWSAKAVSGELIKVQLVAGKG